MCNMTEIIYVQLLNEGTKVYRPISARKISDETYVIEKQDLFNPKDEFWEFLPGTHVRVEKKLLQGQFVTVAVEKTGA